MSEHENATNGDHEPKDKRTQIVEEIEVSGSELVEQVKKLIHQGNIRRVIIRSPEGRVLLDTPLTVTAGVGGFILLAGWAPLAVIGAIAAAFFRVRLEVVREVEDGDIVESKNKVDIDINES